MHGNNGDEGWRGWTSPQQVPPEIILSFPLVSYTCIEPGGRGVGAAGKARGWWGGGWWGGGGAWCRWPTGGCGRGRTAPRLGWAPSWALGPLGSPSSRWSGSAACWLSPPWQSVPRWRRREGGQEPGGQAGGRRRRRGGEGDYRMLKPEMWYNRLKWEGSKRQEVKEERKDTVWRARRETRERCKMTWRSLEPRQVRVRLCDDNVEKEKNGEEEDSILILVPLQLIQSKFFFDTEVLHYKARSPDIWSLNRTWLYTALELVTDCTKHFALSPAWSWSQLLLWSSHYDNSCHHWSFLNLKRKGKCLTARPFFCFRRKMSCLGRSYDMEEILQVFKSS